MGSLITLSTNCDSCGIRFWRRLDSFLNMLPKTILTFNLSYNFFSDYPASCMESRGTEVWP